MKLFPEETKIDFIGKRQISFVISFFAIAFFIFLLITKGLNFGIDFTGGTLIEVQTEKPANISEMRKILGNLDIGAISIQEFGTPNDVLIRIPEQPGGADAQKIVMDKVHRALGEGVDYRRVEFVGPQVGLELIKSGTQAVIFSLLGILLYVWFRFEWQFGVASVVALAHDAIMIIGFFALTQSEFNLSTVAAVLMIAGYSINDTVVVFDRVRENLRKYKKKPLNELFNLSINQMLTRTLMTSITTMLALVSLWVFGGEVIRGFINALIVGIVIGTYSSTFIATPILLYLGIHRENAPDGKSSLAVEQA